MRKIMITLSGLILVSNLYAAKCESTEFKQISKKGLEMQKAWNDADLEKTVSFYADDFMYMSGGKAYTTKESVLNHYADSFGNANDDGKRNLGKLKLDYQYYKAIDANNQLVILEYIWTSPKGEKSSGKDLMMWQKDKKDKKGNFNVIVDFPQ